MKEAKVNLHPKSCKAWKRDHDEFLTWTYLYFIIYIKPHIFLLNLKQYLNLNTPLIGQLNDIYTYLILFMIIYSFIDQWAAFAAFFFSLSSFSWLAKFLANLFLMPIIPFTIVGSTKIIMIKYLGQVNLFINLLKEKNS